uniref:MSP domain-containing protein n=1 Tax=Trichuris muris TaxID=70415 RepID=A0A5S6QTZ9_TRIMR
MILRNETSIHILFEICPDGPYRLDMRSCPQLDEVGAVVNTQVRVVWPSLDRDTYPRHSSVMIVMNVPLFEWY